MVQPNLSAGGAHPVQEMLEGGPSCMTRIEIFPAIFFLPSLLKAFLLYRYGRSMEAEIESPAGLFPLPGWGNEGVGEE